MQANKKTYIARYVVQNAPKTTCVKCGLMMDLLIRADGNMVPPAFYICFSCRDVYRVGVGKVVREDVTV